MRVEPRRPSSCPTPVTAAERTRRWLSAKTHHQPKVHTTRTRDHGPMEQIDPLPPPTRPRVLSLWRPVTFVQPRSIPVLTSGLAAGALIFALAMSQGGYDIVSRQTIAVVIWWLVGLTAVVAVGGPSAPRWSGVLVTVFAAGIAGWIALNLEASASQERSVVELGRAVAHLGPVVLLGWALPARWWRGVLVGLVVGGVAVCIAALGNRVSPGFLGQTTAIVFTNTSARLSAPLGYWNAVGSWSVITMLLLMAIGSHGALRWQRALAMSALPLVAAVGYLTYSRSSVAAAAVGLVVLLALAKHRWTAAAVTLGALAAGAAVVAVVHGAPAIAEATGSAGGAEVVVAVLVAGVVLAGFTALCARLDGLALRPARARVATIALVALAVGVGGVSAAQYGPRAWDKFSTFETTNDADPTKRLTSLNNGARVEQWKVAIESWKLDKANGSGAGTYELTYNRTGPDAQFVRDAHSAFLEALSEQGWPGLLLLVGLVASTIAAVGTAARRCRNALDRGLVAGAGAGLAAFTFGTGFDWFWEVTALALYAMALTGAIIAAGKGEAEEHRRAVPVLRVGLVVVALIAVLIELPGLVGTSEVRRSQRDAAAGNLVLARSHADQAIEILPWASSPFLQRALVDEQAGAWRAARDGLALAIERDPYDWRLPLVLARVEAEAGRTEAALAAFRRAKALRPGGQFFQ